MESRGELVVGGKRIAASLIGVGVGAAIGGPAGAVLGAVSPVIMELIALRERLGVRNLKYLMDAVVELTGMSEVEFGLWARHSTGRMALATSAMQAAYATVTDEKIAALAKVVAENIDDDATLDYRALVVRALSEMEAPHIRVLHTMVNDVPPPLPGDPLVAPGAWMLSQLVECLPHLSRGIEPIAEALSGIGVLDNKGLPLADDNPGWRVTQFGRNCLAYLTARIR